MTTPNSNTTTREGPDIDNWIKWFDSRDSSTFVNKQAQEELFQAFNASVNLVDCKKNSLTTKKYCFFLKKLLRTG